MIRAGRSIGFYERPALTRAIVPAAFAIFAAIGAANRAGITRKPDLRFRRKVRPKKNRTATRVANAVSLIGAPHSRPVFAVGVAAACHLLGMGRPSRIMAAALAATALNKATRLALHQKRPPGAGVHHGLDVYAYPSGHCCAVAAIMSAAAGEASHHESAAARNTLVAAAAIVSLATAWSRLYLDEHWLDDVVGGLCAGAGIGLTLTDA